MTPNGCEVAPVIRISTAPGGPHTGRLTRVVGRAEVESAPGIYQTPEFKPELTARDVRLHNRSRRNRNRNGVIELGNRHATTAPYAYVAGPFGCLPAD